MTMEDDEQNLWLKQIERIFSSKIESLKTGHTYLPLAARQILPNHALQY